MLPFTRIIRETKHPRKRCWITQLVPKLASAIRVFRARHVENAWRDCTVPYVSPPGVSVATERSIRGDRQAIRSCERSVGERSRDEDDGSGARDIAANATARDGERRS